MKPGFKNPSNNKLNNKKAGYSNSNKLAYNRDLNLAASNTRVSKVPYFLSRLKKGVGYKKHKITHGF